MRARCGVGYIRIDGVGRRANGDALGIEAWRGRRKAWTVEEKMRVAVARMDKERMSIVVYERGGREEYEGG